MSLHDLLDDVARMAAPADALRSAEVAWGSAALRRRRTRVTAGAALVGLVVVAALVGTSIARPAPEPLPGNGQLAPGQGLPARIYDVSSRLAAIGGDPIPPIAYVYETTYLDDPVAVSVDGSYRYLPSAPDVPGYALSGRAVSPDGTKLAMAWSLEDWDVEHVQARATIEVYDLTAGGSPVTHLGSGLGGASVDLAWKPDGQGLAWQELGPAVPQRDGTFVRAPVSVAVFDWALGQRAQRTDIVGPVGWSPDGTLLVAQDLDGVPVVTPTFGRTTTRLDSEGWITFSSAAWAPDGRTVAGIRCSGRATDGCYGLDGTRALVTLSTTPGPGSTSTIALLDLSDVSVVGWRSGAAVLAGTAVSPGGFSLQTVTSPVQAGLVRAYVAPVERFSAASGIVGTAPIKTFPPPEQQLLPPWLPGVLVVGFVLIAAASLGGVVMGRRRRTTAH